MSDTTTITAPAIKIPVIEAARPEDTKTITIYGYVPATRIGFAEISFTRSGCWLMVPYDKNFMQQFKRQIPSGRRRWLRDVRRWWVDRVFMHEALVIVGLHFSEMFDESVGA